MVIRLPQELQAAIRDDQLRQVRLHSCLYVRHQPPGEGRADTWHSQAADAAKKRAVAQHADYEMFKNMVRTVGQAPE